MNFSRHVWITVGALLAISGCSAPPNATTESPSTTSAAPRTKTEPTEEALNTYKAMWGAFAEAGKTAGWQSPGLSRHATGTALSILTTSLQQDNTKGLVSKGEPLLSPAVYSFEPHDAPTKVVITDCGDTTNALKYRKDNGQLADDVPGGKRRINAIVEKQADGVWKVTDVGVHEVGSC